MKNEKKAIVLFCPKCGNEVAEGSSFCSKCGNSINPQRADSAQPIQENQVSDADTAESSLKETTSAKKKIMVPAIAVLLVAVIGVAIAFATDGFGLLGDSDTESGDSVETSSDVEEFDTSVEADDSEDEVSSDATLSEDEEETAYYLASSGNAYSVGGIASVDGEFSRISKVDDYELSVIGPFKNGYAFVTWVTYDYDEEWEENINYEFHLGCIDETGNLVLNLDHILPEELVEYCADAANSKHSGFIQNTPYFNEGYAFIILSGYGDSLGVVIDDEGNLLWTIDISNYSTSGYFENGAILIGSCVYDTEGKILFDGSEFEDKGYDIESAGYGFIKLMSNDHMRSLVDYDGNEVIEDASQFGEYDDYSIKDVQYGYAIVTVYVESPNGTGSTKAYQGVWSLSKEVWMFDPIEDASIAFCSSDLLSITGADDDGYINYQGEMVVTDAELDDASGGNGGLLNYLYGDWYYVGENYSSDFFQIDEAGLIRYAEGEKNMASGYY